MSITKNKCYERLVVIHPKFSDLTQREEEGLSAVRSLKSIVLLGRGSGRMLSGRASFSTTTIFQRSAGSVWRWMDSMQRAVRSGWCNDGMTIATVFTRV